MNLSRRWGKYQKAHYNIWGSLSAEQRNRSISWQEICHCCDSARRANEIASLLVHPLDLSIMLPSPAAITVSVTAWKLCCFTRQIWKKLEANRFSHGGKKMIEEAAKSSFWIRCPVCHNKSRAKVYADTVLLNFPLFCPKCKQETKISVIQLKMVVCNESDKRTKCLTIY